MGIPQRLYKHFTPYFKERGFKKKGNCFFRIENNVAYCITFEFPSYVRVWGHILPLFMPTEFRHLTYGNRIEQGYRYLQNTLSKFEDVSDAQIEMWFKEMTSVLEYDVFSFFESISTPQKLLQYCEVPEYRRNKLMPYGGPNLFRLKSYTALYVGEKRKAKQAISEYENSVLSSSSYDKANTYTQAQVSEIKELYKLLSASDEKRIEYLKNMCCSTAKLFE